MTPPALNGLLLTDLDGTLLNANRQIGTHDHELLEQLGEASIVRVAATGRTLHSAHRVLSESSPIDYLVFSSGAGIMHWPTGEIVHSTALEPGEVTQAAQVFEAERINYEIHEPIPENHRYAYRRFAPDDTDFDRRLDFSGDAAYAMIGSPAEFGPASQLLAVIPASIPMFQRLRGAIHPFLSVVRATSPVDHRSIWFEVFPTGVSKAGGAEWLRRHLAIPQSRTYALGNDYNDEDMLEWATHSAVVENAPEELRERFQTVDHHERNPLSGAELLWGMLS